MALIDQCARNNNINANICGFERRFGWWHAHCLEHHYTSLSIVCVLTFASWFFRIQCMYYEHVYRYVYNIHMYLYECIGISEFPLVSLLVGGYRCPQCNQMVDEHMLVARESFPVEVIIWHPSPLMSPCAGMIPEHSPKKTWRLALEVVPLSHSLFAVTSVCSLRVLCLLVHQMLCMVLVTELMSILYRPQNE